MKRYAVAYMNFYDNVIEIKFVDADNEVDAVRKDGRVTLPEDSDHWGMEEVKEFAFNCDSCIDAKHAFCIK